VPASRHRTVLLWLTACYLIAYVGLAVAPVGGAWVWMILTGIGSGQFPLALTMIGLRSRDAETTAALSAFVQSIGYVVAGSGPLLFGVLNDITGGWALPLALLFIGLAIAVAAGLRAALPRFVDDEMAPSAA
jgi:CP family cyanate transporter-like MFS transporter